MRSLFAVLAVCVLLAACARSEPQTGLPTSKVVIATRNGPVAFSVEVASDSASQD